jgi:hypothetical protein
MGMFAEFLTSSGGATRFDDPDVAWAETIERSIHGMRDAARWMLGVVVGWFILIPELAELRQLLPVERPYEVTYLATLLLFLSVGRLLTTVLNVQVTPDSSIDLANLHPDDLEYVRGWGIMTEPEDLAEWHMQKGFNAFVWQAVRYMTPEEAHAWFTRSFAQASGEQPAPDPGTSPASEATAAIPAGFGRVPQPSEADLMQFGERVYWMRMQEVRAVLLLSQRDMRRRFNIAKWSMLVLGLTATFALIALLGPPAALPLH